jgi:hypothetical protein
MLVFITPFELSKSFLMSLVANSGLAFLSSTSELLVIVNTFYSFSGSSAISQLAGPL